MTHCNSRRTKKMRGLSLRTVAALLGMTVSAMADDFPPGPEHDLVSANCLACHDASMITGQHKTKEQWSETVRRMVAGGVQLPTADFDQVVNYLTRNFGASDTGGPAAASQQDSTARQAQRAEEAREFTLYQAVEGQPFQVHPPEKEGEKPGFAQQTRAPFHSSTPYQVTTLTDKLHQPWGLAFLPDGNILVSELKPGGLRILDKHGVLSEPLAGVPAVSRVPDYGLLDVALDPHFARNHRIFFTFYEVVTPAPGDRPTNSNTYVARAALDQAAGALRDAKVIFRAIPAVPTKRLGTKTGGRILFGRDGNLLVTIGDRDDNGVNPWDVAQRLDTDLGKIIRITPDGTPAPGNPFIGKPGALPEIWTFGNRNPEGLAFDPKTGKLWETEHGPRGGDEVNIIAKGKNYGWPVINYGIDYSGQPLANMGNQKSGMVQPVYYWDPVIAPSGLAFYRGNLFPQWRNSLFAGGLRGMLLTRLTLANDKVVAEEPMLTELHTEIRDVRIGPDGAVYVLTKNDSLLKLTPK